ncbi:MAG: HAMP domain-containing sensor histidine kinase [Paracoccus sp. (in: a-proteobacteria)]|uniref:sensor histidine kinase n=1 Tax=Paracoccus sp. TaxID=267 RepID=UPI0039E53E19
MTASIRWRLVMAGAAAILAALIMAAMGLAFLFDRHVERIAESDLRSRALAVAAMIEPAPGPAPLLREVALDPLYDQVFSGHYWQLRLGDQLFQSRSLWDFTLPMFKGPPAPGQVRVLSLAGPRAEPLIAVEQNLVVGTGARAVPAQILVALDRSGLVLARREFLRDLLPYLSLLGALLLLASFVQITVGLRPLAQVGARVQDLVSGARPRIGTDMPSEVIPLAGQIDKLLDARDLELSRARHRAADLAHGFKTPLQALMGDARLLRDQDRAEIADSIERIVQAMRRHVDRELARARIQTDRTAGGAEPGAVAAKLVQVLRRTPLGGLIDWRIQAPPGLRARIDPDDLTEALGALLENAMRHTHETVAITVSHEGGQVCISIRDDGPGVPEGDLARLTQRGLSLDPNGQGQGIGLALVADVVDAAQGQLHMRNAKPGLEVRLLLNPA